MQAPGPEPAAVVVPRYLGSPAPGWTSEADVLVVGSGIAGLTCALRLREHVDVEVARTSNPRELDGVLHRAGSRTVSSNSKASGAAGNAAVTNATRHAGTLPIPAIARPCGGIVASNQPPSTTHRMLRKVRTVPVSHDHHGCTTVTVPRSRPDACPHEQLS